MGRSIKDAAQSYFGGSIPEVSNQSVPRARESTASSAIQEAVQEWRNIRDAQQREPEPEYRNQYGYRVPSQYKDGYDELRQLAEEATGAARQSVMAYDEKGRLNPWQTALNLIQDAKSFNKAAMDAKSQEQKDREAAERRAYLRPETAEEAKKQYGLNYDLEQSSFWSRLFGRPIYTPAKGVTAAEIQGLPKGAGSTETARAIRTNIEGQARSAKRNLQDTVQQALSGKGQKTGNPVLDTWGDTLRKNAGAAKLIADTYGLPTYAVEGSRTQQNVEAFNQSYADMSYGQKLGANIGLTAGSYGLDFVNAGLTAADMLSGGRLGMGTGTASSIFKAANFLQGAGSGLTAQAYANMRESSNWLGRLVLDLEKTGVEQLLDRTFGEGSLTAMGIRVFGSGAQEAENRGESVWKQALTGGARGAIEIGTEMMSGVGGSWRGTGYGDSFLNQVDKWIASKTGSEFLGTLAKAFTGEAVEEMTSDVLNPLMDRILGIGEATGRGEDRSFMQQLGDFLADVWGDGQLLYDGLLGGLAGMGGGAVEHGIYSVQAKNLAVDVATYKAAERIAGSNSMKTKFQELTGVELSADEQEARLEIALYLTNIVDSSDSVSNAREAETNLFRQVSTGGEQEAAERAMQSVRQMQQETARQYVQQVISNMDVQEAEARVLMDGMEAGEADPQTYAQGIQEAFRLGEMGLSYEQAVENATFADRLNEAQFRHAFDIGARKAGHGAETQEASTARPVNMPEYESIEAFSREFQDPQQVSEIYDLAPETDVNEFAAGFRAAYDMGQSGLGTRYLTEETAGALTGEQRTAAYELGRSDAEQKAVQRATRNMTQAKEGTLQRRKGTVKGEGVSMADLKAVFNDRQNTAYRLLTRYAETTGVNIVLYNSQADAETGLFPDAQGRFQWKDDTIYIDINSGLEGSRDVNSLGKYTMMRTFAHEFTHFVEKWNPKQYNEFREYVFSVLESRGENVHDLVEAMQARDASGKMSYEQASREVVADAMMDVLQDSTLVQQLAAEHQTVFRKLLQKLREFSARMKQYYREISTKAPREAEALKENGAYLDGIVHMWDEIAKGAVENYQLANGEEISGQEQVTGKKEKASSRAASEAVTASREASQASKTAAAKQAEQVVTDTNVGNRENDTRRIGMDFFRAEAGTETAEAAPDLRQMAGVQKIRPAERSRFAANDFTSQAEADVDIRQQPGVQRISPVGRERFAGNDFTSREEAAPDLKGMVPRRAQESAQRQEAQAEAKTPAAAETAAQPQQGSQDTPQGARLRARLDAGNGPVILNGFEYAVTGWNDTTGTGTTYTATVRRVNTNGAAPVYDASTLFRSNFQFKEDAVEALVRVAENNHLLEEAPTNESTETAEAAAPDLRGETGNRRDGTGAIRVSAEQSEGAVQPDAAGGQPDSVPAENGLGAGRNGDRPDAKRNGRSRSKRSGQSRVQSGRESGLKEIVIDLSPKAQEAAAPMTQEEQAQQTVELHEDTAQQVEQKSTEKAGGNNYVIGESLDLPSGSKARFRANADAIRLVKQLEMEGRNATAEEQAVLARYVGWGGIPEAFDERKSDWSKEFAELKELLTDEEYKAARASTTNAHYTSIEVIRAMYDGLQKLGFKGGRMLEPSSGVGNFVGAMPAGMSSSVKSWTMVELDNITGLIAKHLYPQSDVRIEGFEKTILPDNYMDVAIGNVPFGNYPVVDRAYPKKLTSAIHNYFFAKSLDKVRPGGIVMFITSSYTLNSNDQTVRKYLAKQADLLGAIRLPNTAFKSNAGTEVVTDILVLKKRAPGTEYAGQPFIESPWDYRPNGLGYRNEYFVAHPEMVLGEETTTGSMYRRNEYTVNPKTDAGTLGEQITRAFENITGRMEYPTQRSAERTNLRVERAEKGTKQGGFVQKDGKLFQNKDGILQEVQTDENTAKRITGMLGIRDFARQLLNAQQQGVDAKSIQALRRSLNKAYDSFVKENGYLNSPANRKAFMDDPDRFSLYALENWDAEKKTATKADIFTTDTIKPNLTITHADTVKDGLVVSRNTTGGIDVPLISRLTGKSEADVTRELIDGELAFKTRDGSLEPAETYLSGNVRAKLRDAQGLVGIDKDYQHNVDALQAIIPEDIPHEQIFVQPGTPWIPESVYSDFAAYMLGGNNHRSWGGPDVAIHRSNQTGTFTIDLNNKRLKANYLNMQEWGTPKRSFLNLLEAMMNSRSVTVTYKDNEGHTIVDRVATDAANEKIEQITKKFQEWLWADEERTKDLEYLYNETFNNLVTPKYDGSTLTVNGLRAGWSLRPHQADAVQRIVSSGGNTLLAHRVGAGKTLEMAAAAMKLKELGIVQKPMFTVPKSLVAQWGKEFKTYFPAAKLLVAEQSDFTPANRKTFANRIATGNYDAIIVSYEQFEKIPISDSFAMRLYQQQIDEIIQAINEAKEESGAKSMSVKDMEKKRKQLEAKIQKLSDKPKDTDSIEFEQLGIDSIFVDEAHNFKNLFYTTSMTNIAGLGNKDGSGRAFDMYTKVRYLQQLNGGRGVVFATATPVMNSMSEMYIMQKYLQPDLLDQLGLSTFDAWAKQFGEVVNGMEIKPSGQGWRVKQSFSRFKNMSELQLLFRNFSDVLTKVPGLKIPKMRGGKVITVECEPGQFQQDYMQQLVKRADNIKNVDPSEDNMLKITSDGRKISYTQRMIDPSLPYEEGCKIYRCAENVAEEYKNSKSNKGTQIIFLDMATPKGKSNNAKAAAEESADMDTGSAQLYEDLKKRLVKLGIPGKEIAFIHDADTDAKKSKLFDDVNEGRVRVLIGSTGKMGVGMNAQKRIVAIHHLDAPWRPGDVEQRDGRAFRQGNINEEVAKYVYVTSGSFDARLWGIIDRKSSFIDQIMNGENVGRDIEDTGEVTLSAAEVMALASGNPLIKEQVELEADIKKLQNLYMAHRQSVVEAGKKLQEAKQAKAEAEARAASARKDIKHRTDASTDEKFSMTVGNKAYTDKKEAGKVLMAHAAAKATEETYTKIGSFAGFDVSVMQTKEGIIGLLKADGAYRFHTYPDNTTLMITNMQKVLNGLDKAVTAQEELARQKAQEIQAQEAMMKAPFPKQAELDQKRQRYNEVMELLNPKEEQAIDGGEDEDNVEYSLRDKRIPGRRELEAKGNIQVVDIRADSEGSFRQQRADIQSSQLVKDLVDNPVFNNDTGEMLFVLPKSITHSFSNRGGEQMQMVRNLRAILENAVLTHREDSRTADNDHTTGVYKFFAAVRADEGVMPVKITVKEYFLEGQSLPASVSRYLQGNPDADTYASVYDGKVLVVEGIEKETPGSVRATSDAKSGGDTYPEVSTISIRELLSLVKGEDLKYLPQEDAPQKTGPRIRQEFSSAATSRPQVAKLFKSKAVDFEDTNIDIGGGKYNYTTEYLAQEFGTTNMVYDPYNRGSDENLAVVEWLRAGNRADTATCANVLNVIKEQEARRNVILEVAKSIKEDGTAYFSTWEDNKANQEKGAAQTGEDSWQNRRKTADYVHEVEEFFDDVVRKGDVIIAKDPKADLPAAFWRITEEEEIEYSNRRNSLSNREILTMAAAELDSTSLSDAERNALDIFKGRLERLQEAQEQRAEIGRRYKDEQFTKGGSRAEAARLRNSMQVLDGKIRALDNSLLSLENKDVLRGVLEKARAVVESEERKRGDETLKRYRERRNESMNTRKYREYVRAEVETLRKWLVSPSNKDIRKHVPAEIQKTVADFLESINLMSKTALRTSGLDTTKADEKYLKNMKKMRDAIKKNVDSQGLYSGYADLPADFIETFEALIGKTEQLISQNSGGFVVNQMSAKELQELTRTLKTLRKFITTMNAFHNNAVFQHTYEAGEETIEHLTPFEKSRKSGTLYKFLRFDYMRPSYAFEHFGKGGQSIEHEFREGQATQARLANRIIDFAKKTYSAKEVKTWGETVKSFTLSGGETVQLPVTHLMSLYCLNKRPQALTHIYGDGIRVANYKEGGKVQLDEGHLVSFDDVQQMISTLTPRQKEVADALQKYMSTECAEWGNYVSMKRFDVEQFGEENYFPINSDGRYLPATADESPDNSGLYALLNMGFTKELKENASNRIILYNIFDVFANHTASMTQYRSFALPVLDALKWFNYKNDSTSVRTKLSSAFGAPVDERAGSGSKGYAESFVLNLIRAYNGTAAQGDPYDTTMLKMLHRFNGAQIAYNLRVVVQQPTAITRAALLLSPAKLSKGLGMSIMQMNKLAAEMEEHSGIAAWKALGFYDTNISRGLTDLIKQNPTVLDNVMEVGTKGAEAADRFTWAAMWYAAKDSVKRSDYKTEAEYFKAVTDLFEDVIYKTQVVDSLLTKAEFLRSKGGLARQLGSFMSEPSATMSMLADAHFKYTDDLQRGLSRSEAWQRNGGNIAKTAAVYAVGQVILSAMQAVIDAWRDDDEYDRENWLRNYLQKYLKAFKGNVIEELLPFGKVPIASELYEFTKGLLDYAGVFEKLGLDLYGNDISSGLSMYLKYIDKAMKITIDKVTGNKTNYTNYGVVYNLIRGVSNLSGLPFGTAWRELEDIWNNTAGYFVPRLKLKTYERAADRKRREGYDNFVKQTGMSENAYNALYDKADVDGDGIEQGELGPVLVEALKAGDITEEQADAFWRSNWNKENSTTFEKWRAKNGGGAEEEKPKAAAAATTSSANRATQKPTPTATPKPAEPEKITTYEQFKSSAPVYSDKKDTAFAIWQDVVAPTGIDLDTYVGYLKRSDTDGNGSVKQTEFGPVLHYAIQRGEITEDQANALWYTLWNSPKSKSFSQWAYGG